MSTGAIIAIVVVALIIIALLAFVLPRMRAVSDATGITTAVSAHVRGLEPQPGSAAEALAIALTGANDVQAVSYGTEGGLFQALGIPTVVCGPGDIEQAHKPDEFIALSQVGACIDFMHRLAARISAD